MFALMKERRSAPAASVGFLFFFLVINYILEIKKGYLEDECMSYWAAAGNLLRHLPIPHSLDVCFKSRFAVLG